MALIDAPRDNHLAAPYDPEVADLIDLAQSRKVADREHAAGHPATPMGLLIALASDPKTSVRVALAGNPTTGGLPSVMSILSGDATDVQVALVTNPAVPTDVVRDLAERGKRAVRKAAEARVG